MDDIVIQAKKVVDSSAAWPKPAAETREKQAARPAEQRERVEALKESLNEATKGNQEALKKLTEGINEFMKEMSYSLQFIPDREKGRVVIKVLDSQGKVIRRIPPEEILNLSSNLGSDTGLLVNEKLE